MIIRTEAATDLGNVRENNEDRFLVTSCADPSLGTVLCVADGMGGHPAGEDASQAVVDALSAWPERAAALGGSGAPTPAELRGLLSALIAEAHERILELGQASPHKRGLGTTAVAALILGDTAHVVHCGDSRAYRLRGDALEQLTTDHTVVDQGVRFLAAHVGMPEGLRVTRKDVELAPGDRLLLCSDGLTDMLPAELFGSLLLEANDPAQAVADLIRAARAAGGYDNITCAVAWVEG